MQLTDLEYRFPPELSVNAGRALTHDHLLRRVWGPGHSGKSGPVHTGEELAQQAGGRANNPSYVFNEPSTGYRMERGETAG